MDAEACEALEGRVVLSGWGDSPADSATNVRVVLPPIVVADRPNEPGAGRDAALTQLLADEQMLRTELQRVSAKPDVTVADLTGLNSDSPAFAQAGNWFDGPGLQKAMTALARSVAEGSDTTQARSDFNTLFSGSSVPQSAIDAAFDDLVQAIKDLGSPGWT